MQVTRRKDAKTCALDGTHHMGLNSQRPPAPLLSVTPLNYVYINGLVQACSISSAVALEILQLFFLKLTTPCTIPLQLSIQFSL